MDDYWVDKAAVVTGGARGQGSSITMMLVGAGAHVYVMDNLPSSDSAWQKLRESSISQPGTLTCLELDVARPQSWEAVVEMIQTGNRALGGLVNNAGITGVRNTVTKASLEEWEQVLRINLTGAVWNCRPRRWIGAVHFCFV